MGGSSRLSLCHHNTVTVGSLELAPRFTSSTRVRRFRRTSYFSDIRQIVLLYLFMLVVMTQKLRVVPEGHCEDGDPTC